MSKIICESDSLVVGADGFEPPKSSTADLQSAPFGHSGIRPLALQDGLEPTTNDPEITNHVLWPTELKRQMRFKMGLNQRPPD